MEAVDLIVPIDDADVMRAMLEERGFGPAHGRPENFVLRDGRGRQVDVHLVRFDDEGNGVYAMENGETWIFAARDSAVEVASIREW